MSNQNQAALLQLGTQVSISNGEPRPPERFNNKLKAWKHENYIGVIVKIAEGYTIQRKPDNGWRINDYIIMFRSRTDPAHVAAIPGTCIVPLTTDGFSSYVDVPALLAIEPNPSCAAA